VGRIARITPLNTSLRGTSAHLVDKVVTIVIVAVVADLSSAWIGNAGPFHGVLAIRVGIGCDLVGRVYAVRSHRVPIPSAVIVERVSWVQIAVVNSIVRRIAGRVVRLPERIGVATRSQNS